MKKDDYNFNDPQEFPEDNELYMDKETNLNCVDVEEYSIGLEVDRRG